MRANGTLAANAERRPQAPDELGPVELNRIAASVSIKEEG